MRFLRSAKLVARAGKILTLSALLLSVPATAMANPKYAGIVVDAKTGKTLYSSSADAYRYPASLTKIMTLYVVFEELEAGRLSLSSQLKVSKYAAGRPPSKIGVKAGGTIKVKDAILALVTKSANDVATVVAENIGGSEKKFAERMTRTARQLGMSKTTFRNPHGLPNSGQRTTARDMARLGRAIQERFPQYYGYFKTRAYKYKGRTYGNHNKLLGSVKGVDGIKTGYIRASGFNLVTSVKRDGRHIVAVVMGGKTGKSRNAQMTKLINRYLRKASRGPKTAPAIAKRQIQPVFVASSLKNPPLPRFKPGSQLAQATAPAPAQAQATGAPLVLAFEAPAKPGTIPTPQPAPVPGFGNTVPVPPKLVKHRFDSTFAVATALPPIPPASPDASLTTNSISQSALLQAARQRNDKTATQTQPARSVAVETITIEPVPVETVSAKLVENSSAAGLGVEETGSRDDNAVVTANVAPAPEPGWQVQIAATETENQAVAMLQAAQAKTGRVLRDRVPYTEPVESGGQTLYRARFVGFDTKSAARKACRSLKKAKYACFAIYQ